MEPETKHLEDKSSVQAVIIGEDYRDPKQKRRRILGYKLLPPAPCWLCGAPPSKAIVHHKDGDFTNNDPNNLERICKSCHAYRHSLGSGRTEVIQRVRRAIASIVHKNRLTGVEFSAVYKGVRKSLKLKHVKRSKRLPRILSDSSLRRFYQTIDRAENLQHQIMLRLLFYTALRVSEFCRIRVSDVDLAANKVFIESGKGDKDRYILFPDKFKLLLRSYIEANPENVYLFESKLKKQFSPRRIQQIVQHYAEEAELEERVHPHLFRHQMLTWLTKQGMPDAQIQLISGHSSKKSLEIYQHLSLDIAEPTYQKAAREIDI